MLLVAVVTCLVATPPADAQPAAGRQAAIDAFVAQDLVRAERLASTWLESHAQDVEVHLLLGLVKLSAALQGEAEGRPYESLRPIYDAALASLETAEQMADGRPLRQLNAAMGTIRLARGELSRAVDRLTLALAERPDDPVLLRERGKAYLRQRRHAEARSDLERATTLAPGDTNSWLLRSEAEFLLGRELHARDTLITYYEQISGEPKGARHFKTAYEIGRYSVLLNDLETARDYLERAVTADPSQPQTRSELGRVYFKLALFEAAESQFDALLEMDGAAADLRSEAWHHKGMLARERDDPETARRHFEAALELTPTRAEALKHYGATLRLVGEDRLARETLERFREVVKLDQEIHQLRNSLTVSPRDSESRRDLIERLVALERLGEAARELEQLKRDDPDNQGIPGLERRLADKDAG